MRKLGHQMYIISYKFPFGYLINEMAFLDFIPAGVVFNFPIYWFDVHGVIQRFNNSGMSAELIIWYFKCQGLI